MIDLHFHSPEESVKFSLISDKINLTLKRDDLIHPFISGNKWRKLKYHLRKAESLKKSHLVTFGGAYSNHLLATAAATAKFGFRSTGIVRGEEVTNPILQLCRLFGMELIFVDRVAYKDKITLFERFAHNKSISYFLDEGGFAKEAEFGCRELIDELQCNYNHIFCAAGTGATSAGIINQINIKKLSTQFHMIPVLKPGLFLKDEVAKLLVADYDYEIHTAYHFGGYAKVTAPLIKFIKEFSSQTGILIDPVYTGKVLYAIADLAQRDYFQKDANVLMIHSGGTFGTLGMLDKF